jgi:cysteine-rich repeat protein
MRPTPLLAIPLAVAMAGCIESGLDHCADGTVCAAGLACDDSHGGCVLPDQIADCEGKSQWDACSYPGVPDGTCDRGVCVPGGCGNGLLEPAEACDDHNTLAGDGCSADCRSDELCGNGLIDLGLGEECDDGNLLRHDGCSDCADERPVWTERLVAVPNRLSHALAYDTRHGRAVLFGGRSWRDDDTGDVFGDTWEWDGQAWQRLTPSRSPSARYAHAMVYQPGRGTAVMFGGRAQDGQALDDTWEWDGETWHKLTPAVSPAARFGHALAYDARRERVVLFGGADSAGNTLADTWVWDGSNWSEVSPPESPPPRTEHAMAYDASRDRVVLFGGVSGEVLLGDTWEWNGTKWILAEAASSPDPRAEHVLGYHAALHRTVLFGGSADPFGVGDERLGDTWEWDGSTWTPVESVVEPQRDSAVVYDADREVLVLVAGDLGYDMDHSIYVGTWSFAGTWIRQHMAPPASTLEDFSSWQTGATYDPLRQRVVLFKRDRMLEWDGFVWSDPISSTDRSAPAPPPRGRPALAYDDSEGGVLLFGGAGFDPFVPVVPLGDTWTWDGTQWEQLAPVTSPPPRYEHAMAYDRDRDVVILFGGRNDTQPLGDTWQWDGSTWQQLSPAASPGSRFNHVMAYDAARGRIVLYGGMSCGWGGCAYFNDTWEWDGSTWQDVTPAVSPPGARALTYDATRERTVLVGGADGQTITWEWDGSSWVDKSGSRPPPLGDGGDAALSYDPVRGRTLLFGGRWGILPIDTWEFDGTEWREVGSHKTVRYSHAYAYDASAGRVVVVAGEGSRATTLELQDGVGWQAVDSADAPSARVEHAISYDPVRRRLVLFGGWRGEILADTWERGGASWRRATPAHSPEAREAHALAYDTHRGETILFGGRGLTGLLGDTWAWNGTDWTDATTSVGPPARQDHAVAYDAIRDRFVLFGGRGEHGLLDDTWEWDGSSWERIEGAAGPAGRQHHSMVYDALRRRIILFGGEDDDHQLSDTWEWDGSTWRDVTDPSAAQPPGDAGAALVYDQGRQRSIFFRDDPEYFAYYFGNPWAFRYERDRFDDLCTQAIDGDGDGLAACDDPDCWGACTPSCAPGAECGTNAGECGDGACIGDVETCRMCPEDCGECEAVCGDFRCDPGESCPADCR